MADVEDVPIEELSDEEKDVSPMKVEGEATYEKRGFDRVKAEVVDFCKGYRMT